MRWIDLHCTMTIERRYPKQYGRSRTHFQQYTLEMCCNIGLESQELEEKHAFVSLISIWSQKNNEALFLISVYNDTNEVKEFFENSDMFQ
jgi:hypothetical protein